MNIHFKGGLVFCVATVYFRGQSLTLNNILLDTGSGGTVFAADKMLSIGTQPEYEDFIRHISGVGGTELVFTKQIDRLSVGELEIAPFEIEVGAMNYGFELDGIIGIDYLHKAKAVIDLASMEIYQKK